MTDQNGEQAEAADELGPDVLGEVLARRPEPTTAPTPTPGTPALPFAQMDPLLFERLVADVAQSVYRLDEVHAYGRSGQWQGGLDIVGWKGDRQIVYQVRRIDVLTADALEVAVREYASPTKGKGGKRIPAARRFPRADEFVLVTSWPNDDTAVADKLEELKACYRSDFRVRLVDSYALSRDLRFYGAIVGGYFGPYWAETFCDFAPRPNVGVGDAAGLLDDPLKAVGERQAFDEATALLASTPENSSKAAETYMRISSKLRERALPLAEAVAFQAVSAYEAGGDYNLALRLVVEAALEEIETCSPVGESMRKVHELAAKVEDEQREAAECTAFLLRACADWFERGYEVAGVVEKLTLLSEHPSTHTARLGLLIAEQVLADEDDLDDHAALLAAIRVLPEQLVGPDRIRLRCAIADLEIMLASPPRDAYESLRDEAFTDDAVRALVERRYGRACAYVGDDTSAVNAYRRAVIHGWHSGLGGDVRNALRCIASITQVNPFFGPNTIASQAMAGARATTNRDQLIGGASQANVNTLDNLVDGDIPDAVRWAHHWLRLERVNGAERDEGYARRNYARALESAGRHAPAVRQYVNLGSRKLAGKAAGALTDFLDVTRQFASPSEPRRAAAASVVAATIDVLPDEDVQRVADSLADLFLIATDPSRIDSDDAIASLDAIGALSGRLPEDAAARIFSAAEVLVPREVNHYRYIDDEVVNYFIVVAMYHAPLRARAITQLLTLLRQNVGRTEERIAARLAQLTEAREGIEKMASEEKSDAAARILARWQVGVPTVGLYARDRVQELMEEPLDVPKNSFVGGRACTEASMALEATIAAGDDSVADSLLQPWLEHLVGRIRDRYMSADERADAAIATQVLMPHLDAPTKETVFRACIEQFDSPQLNQFDLVERANYQDPLARFKLSDGGATFEATMLLTAAVASHHDEAREDVIDRLRSQIRVAATDHEIADLTAHTALVAEAYGLTNELALSVNIRLRMAAAVLWTRSPSRRDAVGKFLSTDPAVEVRRQLAVEIASHQGDEVFAQTFARLKNDRSASVRNALVRDDG